MFFLLRAEIVFGVVQLSISLDILITTTSRDVHWDQRTDRECSYKIQYI